MTLTFLDLYTTELDRELGTTSTQLFTVARRKAALNWAQLEFVKQTECLRQETTIDLSDGTQEYDIEDTTTDFAFIAKEGISIRITPTTGSVRYIEGDDLERTNVQRLNFERPGWRAESDGTPDSYYVVPNGGAMNLGLVPAPSISAETWVVLLPYVMVPTDLSRDTDEPFTVSGNPARWLRLYHRALVHGAAYDLEKLRKDVGRSATQLQLFEREIAACSASMRPKGGQQMRMAVAPRRTALRPMRKRDPRVWP